MLTVLTILVAFNVSAEWVIREQEPLVQVGDMILHIILTFDSYAAWIK